jgi:hypothetical protein
MSHPPTVRRSLGIGVPLAISASALSLGLLRVRFSGNPDASFYLGHIVDLAGQAARFGQTYHGNRISYILVDRWFVGTFGLEAGLLLARHVMLAAAILAAFALGARWAGEGVGMLAAASIAFVPWLPRELMWTFYDGFAATYLLAGTAFLFVPITRRARSVGEVMAGVLFAAAINANLVLVAVVGLTGVSWWTLRSGDGVRRLVPATARLIGGWALASGVIALTLRSIYPEGVAFPELVALRVGLGVLATDQYFTPLRQLGWRLGHLLPTCAVAFGLIAALVRRDVRDGDAERLVRAAAVQVGGLGAFAVFLHFVTRDTWFGSTYYTIYHLPGTVVGFVAVMAVVVRRAGRAPSLRAVVSIVALMAGWFRLLPVLSSVARPLATVGILAAAASPALILGAGAVAGLLLMSVLGFSTADRHAGSDDGWGDVSTRNSAELDLLRHSVALKLIVEDVVDVDERLQFWHTTLGRDGKALTRLNMVFYGTGEGRVHAKSGDGMPSLSESELAGLLDRPPVVVLLATSPEDIRAGEVALQLAGVRSEVRTETLLDGAVVDVWVRVIALG